MTDKTYDFNFLLGLQAGLHLVHLGESNERLDSRSFSIWVPANWPTAGCNPITSVSQAYLNIARYSKRLADWITLHSLAWFRIKLYASCRLALNSVGWGFHCWGVVAISPFHKNSYHVQIVATCDLRANMSSSRRGSILLLCDGEVCMRHRC